jgi:hypothetical protein
MQKQAIQQVLDELPDDVDIDVLLERIILLEKIEAAEERFRSGQGVDHEHAKERMAAWLQ